MSIFWLTGCGEYNPFHRPLPFPTPAQHDLVVVVRPSALTYSTDENGNAGGIEYDLVQTFAQELGVGIKLETIEAEDVSPRLQSDDYHIAIGWLPVDETGTVQATPALFQTRDVLVQSEASLPITDPAQLAGKTVHAMAGSRQALVLRNWQKHIPDMKVIEVGSGLLFDLLERLGNGEVHYVAIDESFVELANQYLPGLRSSLPLGDGSPVVWQLGTHPNIELKTRLASFIERVQHDGTLARIEDRYLGHVRRLSQADIVRFLGEIETTLPKYRKYFQAAQVLTGIDWRLIAAVAYHESQWDPNATSYTNVRGIMMLTEETADRLQVSNRLDPAESILAGARYINMLKEALPAEVQEPDRTWLALAAYNIGPGSFGSARSLALHLKADPNAWFEMKQVLPKLAQRKYTQPLKIGTARGGEAVILVENIRSYYDILMHNTQAFGPTPAMAESLKRVVIEVENRRKAYSRKLALNKAQEQSDNSMFGNDMPHLPTIDQESRRTTDR